MMTKEQQQWSTTMKAMVNRAPTKAMQPPTGWVRLAAYELVNSAGFDGFITAVIVANIGVMACDYWGIENDEAILSLYDRAMDVFSMIYCRSPAASQTLDQPFLICIWSICIWSTYSLRCAICML